MYQNKQSIYPAIIKSYERIVTDKELKTITHPAPNRHKEKGPTTSQKDNFRLKAAKTESHVIGMKRDSHSHNSCKQKNAIMVIRDDP